MTDQLERLRAAARLDLLPGVQLLVGTLSEGELEALEELDARPGEEPPGWEEVRRCLDYPVFPDPEVDPTIKPPLLPPSLCPATACGFA
jgi:hypothetical protein